MIIILHFPLVLHQAFCLFSLVSQIHCYPNTDYKQSLKIKNKLIKHNTGRYILSTHELITPSSTRCPHVARGLRNWLLVCYFKPSTLIKIIARIEKDLH